MKKAIVCALILLLAALPLLSCGRAETPVASDTLYVAPVENLPEDFILGMDVSSVLAEEMSGVKYYDFNGNEADLFRVLSENGVTHIRVRVWNDPYDTEGHGYGGGNCGIYTALEIGKRAAKYGMGLIVDFHYSDFWADPGKQMVPRAWAGMEIDEKSEALYAYTKECLTLLKKANVKVAMVSLGNETNGALCGETKWAKIQALMQAGARAVREVLPEALVAVHFTNPEHAGAYADYAWRLDYYAVDYDVFASSYYPYWHGTLENLAAVLSEVAQTYGKQVMVMETAYAYTGADTDFFGNTVSDGSAVEKPYPFTVQGQASAFRDVVNTVANKTKNGIGVVYWEGAWIAVGTESFEKNSALWEQYGSGWASSYAAVYDPADAGKYFGGSAVDNQAFFGPDGRPLESIKVFSLLRSGSAPEPQPDAVEDTLLTVDLNGQIELPLTVNAVFTDGSKREVPVEWNVTPEELDAMRAGGANVYEIKGTAGGMEAVCRVKLTEFNYLTNDSFESGDLTGWVLTESGHADELYVEKKPTDSLTGDWHMHFWSAAENSVEFTLEQTPQNLPAGKYKFSISIMGGDCGATEIYAYAKINGETVHTCPMGVTVYNEWDTGVLNDIEFSEGQTLTVGISVKCAGEGNGAWGKIDDAMLNTEK